MNIQIFFQYFQVFNLLVYQILQIYQTFASRAIYPIFSSHILYSDENFWLNFGFHNILRAKCFHRRPLAEKSEPKEISIDSSRLWELTDAWCNRQLSNFDYLMKLNEFSGNLMKFLLSQIINEFLQK